MTQKSKEQFFNADNSPEQLYAERKKRIVDAIQLKKPDCIPVFLSIGYMLAELGGISKQELYENPEKTQELLESAAIRFQPDMIKGLWHTPEPSRILGDRLTRWPGYGLGKNGSFQFIEHEFMKAEDYDDFLRDPSDWAIRVYTPRMFSNLEGLSLLPPLGMWLFAYYNLFNFTSFLNPSILESFERIYKAAKLQADWARSSSESSKRLSALGFPPMSYLSTMCTAPFDFMSDTLRGMQGIFIDMMRCPEKLLAAEEKVAGFQIEHAVNASRGMDIPSAFFPLHKGSDNFMTIKQFEKFYWPQLKAMLLELINKGVTPWLYYEGVWDNRLEYLAELPKGKTIGIFDNSDIFKVKEIAGDTMCIIGGMPVSMLMNSSSDSVRAYTRDVCERVGLNGGFIFHTSIGDLEGCSPELISVWIDAVKEFGAYN